MNIKKEEEMRNKTLLKYEPAHQTVTRAGEVIGKIVFFMDKDFPANTLRVYVPYPGLEIKLTWEQIADLVSLQSLEICDESEK